MFECIVLKIYLKGAFRTTAYKLNPTNSSVAKITFSILPVDYILYVFPAKLLGDNGPVK